MDLFTQHGMFSPSLTITVQQTLVILTLDIYNLVFQQSRVAALLSACGCMSM